MPRTLRSALPRTGPPTVYDQLTRLPGRFQRLTGMALLAGWNASLIEMDLAVRLGLPNQPGADVVDLLLAHPAGDLTYVVRFAARRVGTEPGVYRLVATRRAWDWKNRARQAGAAVSMSAALLAMSMWPAGVTPRGETP